jgi:hypothetical protein
MIKIIKMLTIVLILFSVNSCLNNDPNINLKGKDELKSLELDHKIDKVQMHYNDLIYIPIYSDIYVNRQNQRSLLAATLSIRNSSYSDSLFVSKIDYFNTDGILVRSFIDNPISLPPMATVNYVIEKEDEAGGSGANFIVALSARNKNVKPVIQAIMIGGTGGNQLFSFSTDGYSIKEQ